MENGQPEAVQADASAVVAPISAPPVFLSPQDHDAATSATPASFADIPPRLVLDLDAVRIQLECEDAALGLRSYPAGHLWLTEQSLSFLPSSASQPQTSAGFTMAYPLIVLHAVSSTLSGFSQPRKCIYCQIETMADRVEEDYENEDADTLKEMWIVPAYEEQVEPLFQALSYCASLYPSLPDDGEGAGGMSGGHPFGSIGPFGTGLPCGSVDGQFDDVDELVTDFPDTNDFSGTGRAQLARLDALLDEEDSEDGYFANGSEDRQPPGSSTGLETSPISGVTPPQPSANVISLSTHPDPYPALFAPPLLPSLLALLDAYAPVVGWDPIPVEGTMRVVFDNRSRAQQDQFCDVERVKQVLDGLKLETLADIEENGQNKEDAQKPVLKVEILPQPFEVSALLPRCLTTALPRMDAPDTHSRAPSKSTSTTTPVIFAPTHHLLPPNTDRNFLISPPGSPPIGWEPIREDPPNRETLAGDLIEALRRLASARAEDEKAGDGAASAGGLADSESAKSMETGAKIHKPFSSVSLSTDLSLASPSSSASAARKIVLLNPSEEIERIGDPLAYSKGHGADVGQAAGASRQSPHLLLPAVTVQLFGDDADADDAQEHTVSGHESSMDITRVKATIESMRGSRFDDDLTKGDKAEDTPSVQLSVAAEAQSSTDSGQRGKITPTSRPPLAP